MAQQISVNVYSLDGNTSGYPLAMSLPTQGFTALAEANRVIGSVRVYSNIKILATNQQAFVVETPSQLQTLSNA